MIDKSMSFCLFHKFFFRIIIQLTSNHFHLQKTVMLEVKHLAIPCTIT